MYSRYFIMHGYLVIGVTKQWMMWMQFNFKKMYKHDQKLEFFWMGKMHDLSYFGHFNSRFLDEVVAVSQKMLISWDFCIFQVSKSVQKQLRIKKYSEFFCWQKHICSLACNAGSWGVASGIGLSACTCCCFSPTPLMRLTGTTVAAERHSHYGIWIAVAPGNDKACWEELGLMGDVVSMLWHSQERK